MILPVLLALLNALPARADVITDGEFRLLRIRAAADDELRARDGWQEAVREPLRFAGDFYEEGFGIRFQVVELVEWDSDDTGPGLGDLVEELEAEIPLDGVDVVIGFSAQKPHTGKYSKHLGVAWGLTPSLGRVSMVRAMPDDETYDLHLALIHEIAHLFGAFHVADQDTVMRESVQGPRTFRFDTENAKMVRLLRDLDFAQGVGALPVETLRRITGLWRSGGLTTDGNPAAEALFNLGVDLHERDKPEEALATWRRAASYDEGFAEPHGSASLALGELGRYEEAFRELRIAEELGWPQARQVTELLRHERDSANKPAGPPEDVRDKP